MTDLWLFTSLCPLCLCGEIPRKTNESPHSHRPGMCERANMTGELSASMPSMPARAIGRTRGISPEDAEEARWIVRARIGDEAAFAWLLARYRNRAIRLANSVLRRPDEAEDA